MTAQNKAEMGHTTDNITAVLEAVEDVVRSLSPHARDRLAGGAGFVRMDGWAAKRLLAAYDVLNGDEQVLPPGQATTQPAPEPQPEPSDERKL